jgi:MFS family permease
VNPEPAEAVATDLSSSGRPGWKVAVLLVMAAVAVSQGFARFTYAFVLPDMTADILGSYSAAGALGAANLGGYLIGVVLMTAFAHRFEATRLMKTGLALTVLGLLIVATAPHPALLFVGMLLAGCCSAGVWIPCASVISAYAPAARRGVAFGVVTAGIGIAIALTGRITAWVHASAGEGSWRPVWGVVTGVCAVVLILVLAFLRPVDRQPDLALGRVAVRKVLPGAPALLLSYGIYGVSFAIYTNFLVAALKDGLGYSSGAAANAYSLLGLASILGGVVLGRVSDRLGRRPVLVAAMLLVGVAAVVIPLGWAGAVLPSVIAYGLLMTGIGAVIVAYLSDLLEPRDMAAAFGAITLSLGVAQLVAPPVGGWLADATGSFRLTFVLAGVAGAVAGVIAVLLPGRARHTATDHGGAATSAASAHDGRTGHGDRIPR